MTKATSMAELVTRRKADVWSGYQGIGEFHGGYYECDHVSPLSIRAGNLDASVMILAQDWDSADSMAVAPSRPAIGYDPELPTNVSLDRLLLAHFELRRDQVFATNLFPFVKPGAMSANIPHRDLVRAAREYAIPQIEIVQPRLVICLGLATFNAVRVAAGLPRVGNLAAAIEQPFEMKAGDVTTLVCCQSHPGALGKMNRNRGGVDRVSADWAGMAARWRAAGGGLQPR